MQVKKIGEQIEKYSSFLQKDQKFKGLFKYKAQLHFEQHWDIDAPDFPSMYDSSFYSEENRSLWKQDAWLPKEMMVKFAKMDPEFTRRIFKDLFNETKEITARISRFKFGCDTLLEDYKKKNKNSIENNHFHDDNHMIFTYLHFRFPGEYCLWEYTPFQKMTENIGVIEPPTPYDIDRFLKITKVLFTFLHKDLDLIKLHTNRLSKFGIQANNSRMIVHDFFTYKP